MKIVCDKYYSYREEQAKIERSKKRRRDLWHSTEKWQKRILTPMSPKWLRPCIVWHHCMAMMTEKKVSNCSWRPWTTIADAVKETPTPTRLSLE